MAVLERVQSTGHCPGIDEFLAKLRANKISRAFIVYRNGTFHASHPDVLAPLVGFLASSPDFAGHEAVFLGRDEDLDALYLVCVHDTRRGPAQGGLRYRRYDSMEDLLTDGLRLSRGMTRKNALARLHWGGGKAVIPITGTIDTAAFLTPGTAERRRLFQGFGSFVAWLNGVYYTAEDVGTVTSDMNDILAYNRFTTCVGTERGGSGNPSAHTAEGVRESLRVAWRVLTGVNSLEGVRVAVQGAGNVGSELIKLLVADGARLWVSDVREAAVERMCRLSGQVQPVHPDSIYDVEAEVFAPCAHGATVNAETIPRLRHAGVRLILGAANNILGCDEDAVRLTGLNILFVPDFVCNRLGICNCSNEPFGYLKKDMDDALRQLAEDVREILVAARRRGVAPLVEANDRADRKAAELHPLFGHRGRALIDQLMQVDWSGSAAHRQPRKEGGQAAS